MAFAVMELLGMAHIGIACLGKTAAAPQATA
jgi:hypothetical protein